MDGEVERRVLEALDEVLLQPDDAQEPHLERLAAADPALAARVRSLLGFDAAARRALPTAPPQPVAPDTLAPPGRIGVYRLAALLGEGGMGTVWRGERDDGLFEQTVAVKLMRPGLFGAAALAQFGVERRVLARLRHPNIAQLYDGGTDPEGRAWFVMELVAGVALTDYAAAAALDLKARAALLVPVCAAVQHAHQGLVVHADIKPSNILVDPEGRPKLLDFGIARSLGEGEDEAPGHGLTPAYASPQRRAGEPPMPADDVYALGAVLHELATGVPPDTAPPPPLGLGLPREFAAIVAKATASEAGARYAGADALAEDLRRWHDGFPVRALPPRLGRSLGALVRRRPVATASAVTALLGLVAALALISLLFLRSEAERHEADRRFEQARGMAHYMLFDLFDRLTDTPGTLGLRRALAEEARTYLHDLAAAPRAPVEVRAEAAVGYMQLAGVEALFAAGQLGEGRAGDASLREAERLLAATPPGEAGHPRMVHAAGRLKLFQGFRAVDRDEPDAAIPLLDEAVERLAAAARALPEDAEVGADLWQARLTLADARTALGRPAAALDAVRAAVEDYAKRRDVLDRSEKAPLLLARSYRLVGIAQEAAGNEKAAAESFKAAEALLVEEDARRPRRSRTLMDLLDTRWRLAGALETLGQADEAAARLGSAAALGQARLALEPDHEGLRRMTELVDVTRGRLLAAMGRGQEGRAAAEAALAARAARRQARPGDALARRDYLAALRPAAALAEAMGDAVLACARYREAGALAGEAAPPDRAVAAGLARCTAETR